MKKASAARRYSERVEMGRAPTHRRLAGIRAPPGPRDCKPLETTILGLAKELRDSVEGSWWNGLHLTKGLTSVAADGSALPKVRTHHGERMFHSKVPKRFELHQLKRYSLGDLQFIRNSDSVQVTNYFDRGATSDY